MRLFLTLFILLTFSVPSHAQKSEDAVDAAYRTCYAMENTGLTTSCKVGGWKQVVDVRIDMNSGEARKTCSGVAELMAKTTSGFRGQDWKLRIFSPYSGDQPIAVCKLY